MDGMYLSPASTARRTGKTQQAATAAALFPADRSPTANSKFATLRTPKTSPAAIPRFMLPRETCGATDSVSAKHAAEKSAAHKRVSESDFGLLSPSADRPCVTNRTITGIAGRM